MPPEDRALQNQMDSAMKIFLNYRRNDNAHATDRLFERLTGEFSKDNICYDIESIPPAVNWRKFLTAKVRECDVVIVAIGDRWLEELQNRSDPRDMVRTEIQMALELGIPILPLQIGARAIPSREDLPEDIAELADYHGLHLRPGLDFQRDMDYLIEQLKKLDQQLTPTEPPSSPPIAEPTPRPGDPDLIQVRRMGNLAIATLKASTLSDEEGRTGFDAIKALFDKEGQPLIIDLSEVQHISSSGLSFLIRLARHIRLQSSDIWLCNAHPTVTEALRLIKIDTFLNLVDTEEDAIAAIQEMEK